MVLRLLRKGRYALSEASRRPIDRIPASECPFCQEWEAKLRLANSNISADEIVVVTPIQFRQHVGAHMQQLALFSIPRGFLEDDAETKSVTSVGNFQSSIAGLPKAQMTLKFGSLEDALQELQKLHDQTPNNLEVHLLLSKYYRQLGNYSAALVHSKRAQYLHVSAQKGDPDMLTSISQFESVLKELCNYEEEEVKYKEDEAKYEADLGYEHTEAKHKEAEAMYQRWLELRERVLGPEHPGTLTIVNQLALVLRRQYRYKEAEVMYRRVLESREMLGQELPDTLTSVSNLGLVLESQTKWGEAEAMYQRALEARERMLGQEHPDTLTSVSDLGSVLSIQSKSAEAEKMYQRALKGREKVLGPEHRSTLAIVRSLAQLLAKQDRISEALPLYQRLSAGYHKTRGEDHPDTVACDAELRALQERHTYKQWVNTIA
jgi:tetratricopeptide (TPR) repeat protein